MISLVWILLVRFCNFTLLLPFFQFVKSLVRKLWEARFHAPYPGSLSWSTGRASQWSSPRRCRGASCSLRCRRTPGPSCSPGTPRSWPAAPPGTAQSEGRCQPCTESHKRGRESRSRWLVELWWLPSWAPTPEPPPPSTPCCCRPRSPSSGVRGWSPGCRAATGRRWTCRGCPAPCGWRSGSERRWGRRSGWAKGWPCWSWMWWLLELKTGRL